MTTIFIAGSRNISKLNDEIKDRINNILRNNFQIVVGDADGVDKAVQRYLADAGYSNVVVYCSGNSFRNNVGTWATQNISVSSKLKGRDFYTQKDIKMAEKADYGFMIWDGKSKGTVNNILELLSRKKRILLYFFPEKTFYSISSQDQAEAVIKKSNEESIRVLGQKIKSNSFASETKQLFQETLSF